MDKYSQFAEKLAKVVINEGEHLYIDPDNPCKVLAPKSNDQTASLDLTPFAITKQAVTANDFFANVKTLDELIDAYHKARASLPFEESVISEDHRLSVYAKDFVPQLFVDAKDYVSEDDVKLIVDWIKHFDVYVATKAVESLLNSKADLAMFKTAKKRDWDIHFDHLAIRCGSGKHESVQRVVKLLTEHHGYVSSQIESEAFYQFPDGWNAMPLYKILENGQVLRIFVDQSDADDEQQIIQHWNYVYGFTAHHLAMHATKMENGQRVAIPLDVAEQALKDEDVDIMAPVGDYTEGLLIQVFTRPEKTYGIPQDIINELKAINPNLEKVIQNGKLLELLTRTEMPNDLAKEYFALYDIDFEPGNPLHSAMIFPYFLPAQAAHVIRTSQEVN